MKAEVVRKAAAVGAVDLLVKMHRGHVVAKRTILDAELHEAG
ncbi:hypothetical protein [Amycolatopsis sp. lyj-346]